MHAKRLECLFVKDCASLTCRSQDKVGDNKEHANNGESDLSLQSVNWHESLISNAPSGCKNYEDQAKDKQRDG